MGTDQESAKSQRDKEVAKSESWIASPSPPTWHPNLRPRLRLGGLEVLGGLEFLGGKLTLGGAGIPGYDWESLNSLEAGWS